MPKKKKNKELKEDDYQTSWDVQELTDMENPNPTIVVTTVVVVVGDKTVETIVNTDINKLHALANTLGAAVSSAVQQSKKGI